MRHSNIKKDITMRNFMIVSAFICLAAIVCGFMLSSSSSMYFDFEAVKEVEIYSEEDIIAVGDAIYNNDLILMNDIHITNSDFTIGTKDRPFIGTFNGNGHTIYLDMSSVEEGASLFGCIGEGGIIKNTNFVFNNVTVNASVYSGIASMNYGTIQDVYVKYNNFLITQNKGIYSAAVAINKGTLSNVIVDCTFSSSYELTDEKSIFIGPVCAYNYGTVKNSISLPTYDGFNCTNEYKILMGEIVNVGISGICSVNFSGAATENSTALISDGTYTSDKSSGLKIETSKSAIFNTSNLYDVLDFDNRIWQFSEGGSFNLIVER